jgi:hypothetical protein
MADEKYWVEDPCILLTNLRIFPLASMTKDEKLNALLRLSVIIAMVLYFLQYEHWFTFLLLAILANVLLKYAVKKDDGKKENFTLTPTYMGLDFEQTTVAPLFTEEWQIYPPAYDLYTQIPPPADFEEPLKPQNYPYGQYLTRTNLLPGDEQHARMLNGGTRNAREFANDAFTRNTLGFRDNMTKIFKKSLARRFRQNCNDTFSPFHSY